MNGAALQTTKRGARIRERILQAARDVFADKGPEQATVRDIVSRARCSNATLVKYFGSKDGLFSAHIAEVGARVVAACAVDPAAAPEIALNQIGRKVLQTVIPEIPGYRAAINAINKNPDVGRITRGYVEGAAQQCIAESLRRWTDEGLLRSDNIAVDAELFMQLVKGGVWERVLYGFQKTASDEEIAQAVDDAVRVFLHGVSSPVSRHVPTSRKDTSRRLGLQFAGQSDPPA